MATTDKGIPASPSNGPQPGGVRGFLVGSALGMRPGEGRLAWLFFAYFLVLTTVMFAAKSVRQASFIDALGAENLPWVYLALALISFPVLVVYSRLVARREHAVVIIRSSVANAAVFVAFFLLFGLGGAGLRGAAVLYYVWLGMAFAIAVSQVWSYANHVFDPRQARRLFSFIGAGGLLGAIPGGLLAWSVSRAAGTRYTLLGAAALLLAVPLLVLLIEQGRPNTRPAPPAPDRGSIDEARGGFATIRGSRMLGYITALMAATVIVGQLVGWQFYWFVQQQTSELDERTSVIGGFFALMGIAGFIFQILFTQRIHRGLGVGAGMRVLPATVGVLQLAVLAAATGGAALLFPLVVALMLAEGSLRHSVDQATRELLFLPVPEAARVRAKAFIDVFVQRFAKGISALLILPVTFTMLPAVYVSWLTAVLLGGWLVLTGRVRREYVREYRAGLKSGVIHSSAQIDPTDLTTITTLVQALGSADPRQVLHSLELLSAHGQGHLVPPLLLHHRDAGVRRKTLDIIADAGRDDAVELVEMAVGDDDLEVRSGAMQTLARLGGVRSSAVMHDRLDDPDPELRATAMASLLRSSEAASADRAEKALAAMVADPEARVRAEAARALGEVVEPVARDAVLQLLYDSDVSVVRRAIRSVRRRIDRDGPNPYYVPTLVALMGNRRLKHEAREALVAIGVDAVQSLSLFMGSDDEQIWVRRAVPKTLALLGVQTAADALVEHLGEGDTLLRSKIVEALAFMRSRRSGIRFAEVAVRGQIQAEAMRYLRCLADLWAISSLHEAHLEGPIAVWRKTDRVPTLAQQLLAQRMLTLVHNIFGLLELVELPDDVRASRRSLMSRRPELRARALEYLDNKLSGTLRRDVFSVIDDAPPEEKLRRARHHHGILIESPEATLGRLIRTDPRTDPAGRGIILAALHAVWADEVAPLYELVAETARMAEDPMVRQTAEWVAARAGRVAPGMGLIGRGEAIRMAPMAHIEMMVFLQGVDLFEHCNADQVLRLAAIAGESSFDKGASIFRRGDPPDALYCLVEGRVRLGDADEPEGGTVIGSKGRFGVLDILSGRPRSGDAVAETEVRLLKIDAEDFFDLLSNNIDIVKALFRTVASNDAGESLL